jgi:hypothetical protein
VVPLWMNIPKIGFDQHVPERRITDPISMRIFRISRSTQVISESFCCFSSAQSKELDFHSNPSDTIVYTGGEAGSRVAQVRR